MSIKSDALTEWGTLQEAHVRYYSAVNACFTNQRPSKGSKRYHRSRSKMEILVNIVFLEVLIALMFVQNTGCPKTSFLNFTSL